MSNYFPIFMYDFTIFIIYCKRFEILTFLEYIFYILCFFRVTDLYFQIINILSILKIFHQLINIKHSLLGYFL